MMHTYKNIPVATIYLLIVSEWFQLTSYYCTHLERSLPRCIYPPDDSTGGQPLEPELKSKPFLVTLFVR